MTPGTTDTGNQSLDTTPQVTVWNPEQSATNTWTSAGYTVTPPSWEAQAPPPRQGFNMTDQ